MGLTQAPRIYVDSNVIIRLMESRDTKIISAFRKLDEKSGLICTSEMTLAEVLVKPLRDAAATLVSDYESLLTSGGGVDMVPVTRRILRSSAELRASFGYKTPDAVHVASALESGCRVFMSSDQRIRTPDGLTFFDPNSPLELDDLL